MPPKAAVTRRERDARITADLLADMDQDGLPPWRMPWIKNMLRQCNGITKRPYTGINMMLTAHRAHRFNYGEHRWLTYKQAQAAGGHVRKGERGTRVVFWKFPRRDDEKGAPVPPCQLTTTPRAAKRTSPSSVASSCGSTPYSTPTRSRVLTCRPSRN